ncbi:hypothetical protein [Haloquadratum walsbyi]|uniref:Uncharacterized protein n=1 Tax=Haloquadratum walsbyi J07HQW2 TaxID=1238425 RepID=U1MUK7_9EURY|nr:hypothetical protein [Haloquadratum walsbyi]ERG94029.1 MAG: hypothetical protein J07HQW2_00463 [Haloquadratum walsbyi J07HQW2]
MTVQNDNFSPDSPDAEVFVLDFTVGGIDLGSVQIQNTFSPSGQLGDSITFFTESERNASVILPDNLNPVTGSGNALQTAIDSAVPGARLAVDASTYDPVTVNNP